MKIKQNISALFFYFVLIIVFVSTYILNHNIADEENKQVLIIVMRVFAISLLVTSLFVCSCKLVKFSQKEIFLLGVCFFLCFIVLFNGKHTLFTPYIYLLTSFCITKIEIKINTKRLFIIGLICAASTFYQLTQYNLMQRPVMSYIDPNISGLFIFMLALFFYSIKKKFWTYLLLGVGLLTLSRAYFLATVIFLLLRIPCIKRIALKKYVYNIYSWLIFVVIVPYAMAPIYLNYFEDNPDKRVSVYDLNDKAERLTASYLDESNQDRFLANHLFLEQIINYPLKYLWGTSVEDYTAAIFRNTPHNSIGLVLLLYGLCFGAFYWISSTQLVSHFFKDENAMILYSILPFLLFLGGIFIGISVVLLIIILKINTLNHQKCE